MGNRYRILITLGLAAGATAAIAFVRLKQSEKQPAPAQPLVSPNAQNLSQTTRLDVTFDQFSVMKVEQKPNYDVVLVGDSRTMVGLSPAEMMKILPHERIYNFGFQAAVWTNRYMDAAEKLFDPASPSKVMVVGISAPSLSEAHEMDNGFERYGRLMPAKRKEVLMMDKALDFFSPIRQLRKDDELVLRREYYSDGWNATWRKSATQSMKNLEKLFTRDPASERILQTLLARVSQWRASGIKVYGYNPPVSDDMAAIEEKVAGYNEKRIAELFEKAGGIWISIGNSSGYSCQDHGHLDPESAVQFSKDLAARLKAKDPATF